LRRQAASRPLPAGSSRAERLDPFSLPLRFAPDAGSAGTDVRAIELHTDHVVLLRALAGGKMTISLPLSSYYGVAIRLQPPTRAEHGCAAIVLEHPDPQFSVTLNRAADVRDIASQWQCWGQALELPLLVVDSDGSLREPFASNGSIQMGPIVCSRRSRSALKRRRGLQRLRRRTGSLAFASVHRGEREIIARN
jgi:hypothetical protein